jgi:hypothetical protein
LDAAGAARRSGKNSGAEKPMTKAATAKINAFLSMMAPAAAALAAFARHSAAGAEKFG